MPGPGTATSSTASGRRPCGPFGGFRAQPRDEDGFLVYRTRAAGGLRNQGWKDSADAIRDRQGKILEPPIALAEVQAYAVEARRRIAGLARSRGDDGLAAELEAEATTLAGSFDARFWQADGERYAMAIAAGGRSRTRWRRTLGIASGPAQSRRIGRRRSRAPSSRPALLRVGVRTYAAGQPGFNPLGYHTGSVWPHDSAIAAAGLKRFGFHEEATTVAWAVLEAARRSPGFRLPELFCGFDRDALGVPVVHPVSCAPQAWAAAAALRLVTTMLGLVPHAPAGKLEFLSPCCRPAWARVVVRDLPVGAARVDLLFHRWRGTYERRGAPPQRGPAGDGAPVIDGPVGCNAPVTAPGLPLMPPPTRPGRRFLRR